MDKKLRVWWIPQIPGVPCRIYVESVKEAVKILDVLRMYDAFQYENRIKPDYCNAGGLEMFDPEDSHDGPEGSWSDWYDEVTGIEDPREWLELNEET